MEALKLGKVHLTYITISLLVISKRVSGMSCYQCNSTSERTCGESLPQHHSLAPISCDHIQNANYCVKMAGLVEVKCLDCYICDSSTDPHCPSLLNYQAPSRSLIPKSCDRVMEASYCVKTTGMFEGQLGTKRFCSSRDWGNYCEWVRRPGDEREYRACVFTCQTSGCNPAPSIHHSHTHSTLVIIPLLLGAIFLM